MRLQINVSCSGYEVRLAELGTMRAERAEINLGPGERGVLASPGIVCHVWGQSLLSPPATATPKQPQNKLLVVFPIPEHFFPLFLLVFVAWFSLLSPSSLTPSLSCSKTAPTSEG